MKMTLFFIAALAAAASFNVSSFPSPDRMFLVSVQGEISIESPSGRTLFVIDSQPQGVRSVEVSWSPDSRRVVVVENFGRGSAVYGAWVDASGWHRAIQPDADQSRAFLLLRNEGETQAGLVEEHRSLGNWPYPDAVNVQGVITFQNRQTFNYSYILRFLNGSGEMSRGGFEKGVLTGVDYRIQ